MKQHILQVLTSQGCVTCDDFLTFWSSIAHEWTNVLCKEISILSPEGQALLITNRVFSSPAIILDNELIGAGSYNKEEFISQLRARTTRG